MTLTEFLLARIAEDEKAALPFRNRLGEDDAWRCDEVGGKVRSVMPQHFGNSDVMAESDTHLTAAHIARHDPARVLAECEAKRRIVNDLRPEGRRIASVRPLWRMHDDILAALALPYADHPDWREEWRA